MSTIVAPSTDVQAQRDELERRLAVVTDLNAAVAVLGWDQMTYMPPGGAEARGRQLATLERIAHEHATDPALGRLLDAVQPYAERLPYDDNFAAQVRLARRQYEKRVRVPAEFTAALAEHQASTYELWAQARPANDFAMIADALEKMLDFSRRYADFFPGYEHPADPLIDDQDYGMKASSVRAIFDDLEQRLRPLIRTIAAQEPADDSCLHRTFPEAQQWAFGERIIRDFGYDFQRGRQDRTLHPFATRFASGDVRITTRLREDDLGWGLFSTLHESGHAMYEQGIDPALDGTPLGDGTSAGVHESQSRTWENIVGRSRGFWEHYYPELQAAFPGTLDDVDLDAFYRAINKVERTLIRTEADEVTYNMHVIIRFGLELDLLEGKIAVRDLPELWRARYQEALGVHSADDTNGVLQDVHWYGGIVGGVFQGYTLGNILSAQFYDAALQAHPQIPDEIAQGQFGTLHGWLRENIYHHGSKFTTDELVRRVTGGPLSIDPYMRYLTTKYGALYALA
jgi:carboxypeptidase Taq